MDTSLVFLILIGVTLSFFAIRNGKNSDLFTFAFLFPAVTVAFVLVEFSDFVLNAGGLFTIYNDAGVITVALFMIASCSLLALVGHGLGSRGATQFRTAPRGLEPPSERDVRYMHTASIVLGAMSFIAFLALASLGGGLQQYIFQSGGYAIEWRGLPVYLIFIVRLCYASIVIQLWLWVRTKRNRHLRWAMIFAIIPLINILFIFRRSEVVKLGIFVGYFLTNYRYISIGRVPALAGLVGMYGVFKIFPLLRNEAGKQLGMDELVTNAMNRDTYEDSEIGSGLLRIYQSMESGAFEYGAIFYNAIIQQFVPAGLVGAQTKAALLLPTLENQSTTFSAYLYYVSPMGFAQAYQQFWLLGGLIFFALGYFMARLERDRFFNRRQEIFLVLMIPPAVITVSADLALFVPQLITYLVIVLLCVPRERKQAAPARARRPRFAG
ncbi:hypothetical protein [Erythrobacter sp. THAF29]|uniref:hypothetical protein n=1 Tax=Erythrobacter sp. THAF29 TaxID=2587851 RepID=UPI001268CC6A|nr:hypothetical protein [Erythrobacter sp. THAF29]QFT76315.1 hypothetical protein FIU90_02050 [Erythrobacter sp. THAF29]